MGRAGDEVVAGLGRKAGDDSHEFAGEVGKVGLHEDALVPTAGLRNLSER